ncbi:MAG: prepilin-type N-terminal cleavage/methylation domain-containing protein [Phycisphaeraceae bacterium]|nr:prepilin-type N-terminal cleavage/methylation domain-containing protein [Phycisphaeraceae bacterium]
MLLCGTPRIHFRGRGRGRGLRGGYTLLEVMMAMGIFVVGFVAVASLLPVAMTIQRESMDVVTIERVAQQATAMLQARPISNADLIKDHVTQGGVINEIGLHRYPTFDPSTSSAITNGLSEWSVFDRSYPMDVKDPAKRDFYWVPMILRTKLNSLNPNSAPRPEDWVVYVLILRPQRGYGFKESGSIIPSSERADFYYRHDLQLPSPMFPGYVPADHIANVGLPPGNYAFNSNIPEMPYVPKISMLRVTTGTATGRRLIFPANALNQTAINPSGAYAAEAKNNMGETRDELLFLKVRAGDLIVDQWGKTHTVMMAGREWIELKDALVDTNPASLTYGQPLPGGEDVYFWYAVGPSYPTGNGGSYMNYQALPPTRSILVKVIQVPNAVGP